MTSYTKRTSKYKTYIFLGTCVLFFIFIFIMHKLTLSFEEYIKTLFIYLFIWYRGI